MIEKSLAALIGAAVFVVQAAQAQNLVIQGATLIDGTGRAPLVVKFKL